MDRSKEILELVSRYVSFCKHTNTYLIQLRASFTVGFAKLNVAFDEQIHHVRELEGLEVRVGDDGSSSVSGVLGLLESTE